MKSAYDIVIVGAGPAGSSFARLVDSRQFSVLMLDGSALRPKVCGGLISPDAQDLLARYDFTLPSSVLVSPQLFSVRTLDLDAGLVRWYRRSYLNVDREKFDRYLRAKVPETVERAECCCREIRREDGGFLLETSDGHRLHCRDLVGADGAVSVVRRALFSDHPIKRYTAIQQWFEADGAVDPFYSCVFDSETSESCSWIFFKDGKLILGGAFAPDGCRQAFERQKQKLIAAGWIPASCAQRPVRTEACMVSRPTQRQGVFCGDDHAFLLGEAAGFISPSSFEGISYAMASGEALASAFREKNVLRAYRKNLLPLRLKIRLKCLKRPAMYEKHLRAAVMRSGIGALRIREGERGK